MVHRGLVGQGFDVFSLRLIALVRRPKLSTELLAVVSCLAGLARARAKGTRSGKPIGRPRVVNPFFTADEAASPADPASLTESDQDSLVAAQGITHTLGATLPCPDPQREAVPVAAPTM